MKLPAPNPQPEQNPQEYRDHSSAWDEANLTGMYGSRKKRKKSAKTLPNLQNRDGTTACETCSHHFFSHHWQVAIKAYWCGVCGCYCGSECFKVVST